VAANGAHNTRNVAQVIKSRNQQGKKASVTAGAFSPDGKWIGMQQSPCRAKRPSLTSSDIARTRRCISSNRWFLFIFIFEH
jgi:hypothetical protein